DWFGAYLLHRLETTTVLSPRLPRQARRPDWRRLELPEWTLWTWQHCKHDATDERIRRRRRLSQGTTSEPRRDYRKTCQTSNATTTSKV
ncbi:hypothetical protein ANCDUO_18526, partial [Ancylostoma duodenale]